MTNLQKFAAQQLTKKQMNKVVGGGAPSELCPDGMLLFSCVVTYTNGDTSTNSDCSTGAGISEIRVRRVYHVYGTEDVVSSISCS